MISRGVLLDIPKIKKVGWLENGTHIYVEDLEAAEKDYRVKVEEGDVLFVRTGRAKRRKAKGAWAALKGGMAGLDSNCCRGCTSVRSPCWAPTESATSRRAVIRNSRCRFIPACW